MSLLPDADIANFVDTHEGWLWADDSITRTFELADFSEALGFVTRVGLASEKADHHPDIDIRWNKVTLTLSTHSEGGLTGKDLDLANTFDTLS